MGDELLKLFKLPFVLFGWIIKSLTTIFITLLIIVVILAGKDTIAEKVHDIFVDSRTNSGPIPTQHLTTTYYNIDYILHTFQRGDTISKLARRYNVTENAIRYLNNINRNSRIYYGEILYIPQYTDKLYKVSANRSRNGGITFF